MTSQKTFILSRTQPRYSEVWMDRMIEMLGPDVETVYFQGPIPKTIPNSLVDPHFLLPKCLSRLPRRATYRLFGKTLNDRLHMVLKTAPASSPVLVHYVTNAVGVASTLEQVENPIAVHCHGYDITWDQRWERFPAIRLHPRSYVREVRAIADRVRFIANSRATIAKLVEIGVPESRISLKYIGVPVSERLPERRTTNDSGLQILFLGRLTDFKGPVETIRAFDLACRKGLKGRLVMAGGGPQRKACEDEVKRSQYSERIELLGPVSSARAQELLLQSDLFTAHNKRSPVTGQEEAYGVSVVEAMATGLPVITGRSGGVCETVIDGETGFLFEPGNIHQHAERFCQLATDDQLRVQMGAAGYRRAKSQFSLVQEEHLLKEILKTASSSGFLVPQSDHFPLTGDMRDDRKS